jgi:hypothetical protein
MGQKAQHTHNMFIMCQLDLWMLILDAHLLRKPPTG